MTKLSPADLSKNARLINAELKAILEATEASGQHAITAGHILKACKDSEGHGGWEKWLGQNCPDISTRTASYYMRLAAHETEIEETLAADGNRQRVADLSARALTALIPKKAKTPEQIATAEAAKATREANKAAAAEQAKAEAAKYYKSAEDMLEAIDVDELFPALRNKWEEEQLGRLASLLAGYLQFLAKQRTQADSGAEDGVAIPQFVRRQLQQPTPG